jgi:hypothetical protein
VSRSPIASLSQVAWGLICQKRQSGSGEYAEVLYGYTFMIT